jgi:hypothetical protein
LSGCAAHSHAPREDCEAQEACAVCLSLLAEAAALYGGDFLAGFTLRDSPAFDDWHLIFAQKERVSIILRKSKVFLFVKVAENGSDMVC